MEEIHLIGLEEAPGGVCRVVADGATLGRAPRARVRAAQFDPGQVVFLCQDALAEKETR